MIQQTPNTPNLANLDYPKATKALIKIMNEKMSAYAEADTELAALEDNITDAKYQDALALKTAAIAGEPDPGTASTEAATRKVLYQIQVVVNARNETNKAAQAVKKSINENKLQILELALDKAEAGLLSWQQSIANLQDTYALEEMNRQESLDGLKMFSDLRLTDEKVQFTSNFPVSGNLQVPKTREDQILGITALLRKMFLEDTPEQVDESAGKLTALADGK
jgi:hypothetical protein